MAEEKELTEEQKANAQRVYDTMISMLDHREWHYARHDEDYAITFKVNGDDIPMDVVMRAKADRDYFYIQSTLPFDMAKERIPEACKAMVYINDYALFGGFTMNQETGRMSYYVSVPYTDSLLGEGIFDRMLSYATYETDEYNDKLLMLSKGTMSAEDFLPKEE